MRAVVSERPCDLGGEDAHGKARGTETQQHAGDKGAGNGENVGCHRVEPAIGQVGENAPEG